MTGQVEHVCDQHPDPADCADALVSYSARFDEYGIWIRDGEDASATLSLRILFCPWCGTRLPDSRRDEWFDKLQALGHPSPLFDDSIPPEFKTDAWYRSGGALRK